MTVRHAKEINETTYPDGPTPGKLQPSDYNDDHIVKALVILSTSASENVTISHDETDGHVVTSAGDLNLSPAGAINANAAILVGSATGAKIEAVDGKITFTGQEAGGSHEALEIDCDYVSNVRMRCSSGGALFISGVVMMQSPRFLDNSGPYFGTGYDVRFYWSTVGNDNFQIGLQGNSAAHSGHLSIMDYSDLAHANRSPLVTTTHPTLRVYSEDETSASDYLEFYHDTTQGRIASGDSIFVGDTIANAVEIKPDGEINLHGTARATDRQWVDAGGIKAPGAKPATAVAHGVLDLPAWEHAEQGVEANEESVSFNMMVPPRMDRSVAPHLCIGWSAPGAAAGNANWSLEYLWTAPGEDTAAAAQATLTSVGAAAAAADGLAMWDSGALAVPSATDACLHCRLTRKSAAAADTITGPIHLHGVCLEFTIDKLGTAT